MIPFSAVTVSFGAPNITPYVIERGQYESLYVHTDGQFGYAVGMDYASDKFYIIVLRFSDLAICIYSNSQTKSFNGILDGNDSYCRFVGNGLFNCYNGNSSTYFVQIPSLFIPNGWVTLNPLTFNPVPPCGVGIVHSAYFDSTKKILLQSFIKTYPETTDWYASVYAANNSGFAYITGGFIGNFPNGVNPLLKGAAGGWTYFGTSNAAGNGAFYTSKGDICVLPSPPSPQSLSSVSDISYGGLSCGEPNNQTFLTQSEKFSFKFTVAEPTCGLCTPWANTYACSDVLTTSYGIVANQNAGVIFRGNFAPDRYGCFLTDNCMYMLYGQSSTVRASAIPYNPNGVITLPPVIQKNVVSSLLNWHRPISTTGKFKT